VAEYQLGVIGAGNIAEALLRGVIGGNFLPHNAIMASDPLLQRRQLLAHQLNIATTDRNLVAAGCPRILLAVKPQVVAAVLDEISPAVRDDALVVSIAAGVTTALLDRKLAGKGRIVRVMPNTPMLVGAGMAAIAAGPRATKDDLHWTEQLFGACGQTCLVSEDMMDAVTAVSGSGPAYFFYLIEAMIEAGAAEGLEKDTAARLALQTCAGAAELLIKTGEPPEGLRARVTSPGGTTQRAMEILQAAGVKETLVQAIRAAAQRSRELGR